MTEPPAISAQEVAKHLAWKLSNSNSEIDRGDGTVLDVAFNAWVSFEGGRVIELHVSAYDGDTGLADERSFRVLVDEMS